MNRAPVRKNVCRNLWLVIDLIIGVQLRIKAPWGEELRWKFAKSSPQNLPQITQNDDYSNDHSRYFIHIDHFGNIIFIISTLSWSSFYDEFVRCIPSFRRSTLVFLCTFNLSSFYLIAVNFFFVFSTFQSSSFDIRFFTCCPFHQHLINFSTKIVDEPTTKRWNIENSTGHKIHINRKSFFLSVFKSAS